MSPKIIIEKLKGQHIETPITSERRKTLTFRKKRWHHNDGIFQIISTCFFEPGPPCRLIPFVKRNLRRGGSPFWQKRFTVFQNFLLSIIFWRSRFSYCFCLSFFYDLYNNFVAKTDRFMMAFCNAFVTYGLWLALSIFSGSSPVYKYLPERRETSIKGGVWYYGIPYLTIFWAVRR